MMYMWCDLRSRCSDVMWPFDPIEGDVLPGASAVVDANLFFIHTYLIEKQRNKDT